MIWDFETITLLRTLWSQGHSTAEIGRRLGVSKNSVVGKAHRLDLDARPSPIRRDASSPLAIPSIPRATVTLPPLPSETQAAGIARMAESGYRPTAIAQAMRLDVRSVLAVVPPPRPVIVPQKPLPVSLVPLPPPDPIRRGNCQFPAWSHTERPKFGADGNPLVCSAPAAHGPYCPTHRAVCYTKTRRMANAA